MSQSAAHSTACTRGIASSLLSPQLFGCTAGGDTAALAPGSREPQVWEHVAVGGTFDRLHAGHRNLLAAAALVATKAVYIGVTGPALLQKKVRNIGKRCSSNFLKKQNMLLAAAALVATKRCTSASLARRCCSRRWAATAIPRQLIGLFSGATPFCCKDCVVPWPASCLGCTARFCAKRLFQKTRAAACCCLPLQKHAKLLESYRKWEAAAAGYPRAQPCKVLNVAYSRLVIDVQKHAELLESHRIGKLRLWTTSGPCHLT